MTFQARVRRVVVTVGIAAALVGAGLTIQVASLWAAADAPLSVAPVSMTSVQQALDQERARSAALESELATLTSSTVDLRTALDAAQAQVGADGATADQLRASLTAAQKKLVKLQAALRAAQSGATAGTGSGGGSTGGGSTGGGEGDDGGHDDD